MTTEEAIKQAKASLELEGLVLTGKEEALIRERLEGTISHEEFLKTILERINEK